MKPTDAQLFYQLDQWSQCGYPVAGQAKRRVEALIAERDKLREIVYLYVDAMNVRPEHEQVVMQIVGSIGDRR